MAVHQIPDGSWVSDDGRWLWRDSQWIPMPAVGQTGIFWFISTPRWAPTLLIMGLIGLIPIVGTMDIYGYAIMTARNIRAGYRVLPPANFNYIGLGAPLVVLSLAWAVIVSAILLTVGLVVGFSVYGQTHSPAWAIALGVATGITLYAIASIPILPLFVPALEVSEREGWAIFRVDRLIGHATKHWRSAWYGAAIFIVWYAIYFAMSLVLSIIPFGSILAVVAGMPVLAPMVAGPVARFNDPPARFTNNAANAVAAAYVAVVLMGLGALWGIGLVAASFVNGHPDEVACVVDPGCTFAYSGNLEAIAKVRVNSQDPTLVTVDVTYINRSTSSAPIDPAGYYARTSAGAELPPSQDCTVPQEASVEPGGRLAQRLCFRLPASNVGFQVHLPVIGWDTRSF